MKERDKCPKCHLRYTYRHASEKWYQDLVKCKVCNFEMWVPKEKKEGK